MRTDYKIGIAVALLLAIGLVAYFVMTSNDTSENTNKDQAKAKADSDSRNIIVPPGDDAFAMRANNSGSSGDGGGIIKVGKSGDLLPPAESLTKTQDKSGDLVAKPKDDFKFSAPTETKTYGRKPGVLMEDTGDSSYDKATPSFTSKTTGTGSTNLVKSDTGISKTTDTDKMRFHTVREGESGFTAIAKIEYGNAKYWTLIRDANPGVESTSLHAGDVLKIPPLPRTTGVISNTAEEKPGTLTKTISGGSTYIVKDGDSYWKIAKEQYGDGNLFNIIQEANKNIPADGLKSGQKIVIPPKPAGSNTAAASRTTPSTPARTTERTTERTVERIEPVEPDTNTVTNDKGEVFD